MAIVINLLIRIAIEGYQFLIQNKSWADINPDDLLVGFVAFIDTNYLIYFVMLFIIYAYYYLEQIKSSEEQKRILQNQLLHTKIKLLSSQLQPHFLFNTLNSIMGLINTDSERAQQTVADLGLFLRKTLDLQNENFITIKQELKIIRPYLRILKTRFEDHLNIEQHIEMSCLKMTVPSLLLQPIIENSIKHGFSKEYQSITITLTIRCPEKDFIEISITNNGKPFPEKTPSEGTGLSNLSERLQSLYPNTHYFRIENIKDENNHQNLVRTYVRLPILQEIN